MAPAGVDFTGAEAAGGKRPPEQRDLAGQPTLRAKHRQYRLQDFALKYRGSRIRLMGGGRLRTCFESRIREGQE